MHADVSRTRWMPSVSYSTHITQLTWHAIFGGCLGMDQDQFHLLFPFRVCICVTTSQFPSRSRIVEKELRLWYYATNQDPSEWQTDKAQSNTGQDRSLCKVASCIQHRYRVTGKWNTSRPMVMTYISIFTPYTVKSQYVQK